MLKAPGGHTWADSSLICKTEDILKFGRLLANNGEWQGKQILDRKMVELSIQKHSDTDKNVNEYGRYGYGYQIWKNSRNGFSFFGMHGQFLHYDPKMDILFACNSGNKAGNAGQLIYDIFEKIVEHCIDKRPDNPIAFKRLEDTVNNLKLISIKGEKYSAVEQKVNDIVFIMKDNPMGIINMSFSFDKESILWKYENQQGKKQLLFGRNENQFSIFPQSGYSREVGGMISPGNHYRCAASAAWCSENELQFKVQIIDEYIGILEIKFIFLDHFIKMIAEKDAEDFLKEYEGTAIGEIA